MKLIEIFLPVADNKGRVFPKAVYTEIRKALTERFGGVTSFSRAPAHGVTKSSGTPVHDDIIVMEVMTQTIDRAWWEDYRRSLEREFGQDEILIRASNAEKI